MAVFGAYEDARLGTDSFPLDARGATSTSVEVTVAFNANTNTWRYSETMSQPRLDQAWFWSSRWQEMEHEADEDLASGRYQDFATDEEFFDSLERLVTGAG
jgi:hypothetical protein